MAKQKKKLGISLKLSPLFVPRILTIIAIVMIWRGLWNLIDYFFVPDMFILSNVLTIVVGVIMLYLPDGDIKEIV